MFKMSFVMFMLIIHLYGQFSIAILNNQRVPSQRVPSGNQTWQEKIISDFPNKTSIHVGLSIAMFDYERVIIMGCYIYIYMGYGGEAGWHNITLKCFEYQKIVG